MKRQLTSLSNAAFSARESFCRELGLCIQSPLVRRLMALCITHHRLCECECNGCTRDRVQGESWEAYDQSRVQQQAWIQARLEKVESQIKRLADSLGLYCNILGDPRGPTVNFVRSDPPFSDSASGRGADVWNWRG